MSDQGAGGQQNPHHTRPGADSAGNLRDPSNASPQCAAGGIPNRDSRRTTDNRGLLRVIALACSIIAIGMLSGFVLWGYSQWKTKQFVDDLAPASALESVSREDLPVNSLGVAFYVHKGRWSGEIHFPGTHVQDMIFEVESTSPITGEMTFKGANLCVVDVEEQNRTESMVVLTTTAVPGSPAGCAKNGRWELEWQKLDGDPYDERLLGDLVWSDGDSLIGSYCYLYPTA